MDPHELRQREERYRGTAQSRLDEPVLAAGVFGRPVGLAARLSKFVSRQRESVELDAFMIAVTPLRLHVVAASPRGGGVEVGEELAAWDRAAVRVSVEDAPGQRKVTIDVPAAGESLTCSSGKDALALSILRYLQDPAVVAA